jgi:membrane protein required for colicin V production
VNLVDIAIVVILIAGALSGLRRGFIVTVAGILGALLALAVAKAEYQPVRTFLASFAPHSPWLTVISYLLVFLVVWGLILTLARILRRVVRLLLLGFLDRLGGAIVGVIQNAFLIALLLYLGKRVPNRELVNAIKHSRLAPHFLQLVPTIQGFFPHIPQH